MVYWDLFQGDQKTRLCAIPRGSVARTGSCESLEALLPPEMTATFPATLCDICVPFLSEGLASPSLPADIVRDASCPYLSHRHFGS